MSSSQQLVAALLAAALAVASSAGRAAEREVLFPAARITPSELEAYRNKVSRQLGVSCVEIAAVQVRCDDPRTMTIWVFTQPGHQAHPAFSQGRMIFEPGRAGIQRTSHYAGSEASFKQWLAEFRMLDQRQLEQIKRAAGP